MNAPMDKTMPATDSFILTTDCPDAVGIVAAVTGFLAGRHALITECQHFNDAQTQRSFMRTVFNATSSSLPDPAELQRDFAEEVARRFDMRFALRESRRKMRVVVAVSKFGHCLTSMLHRWSTGSLPIQIVAVVSNHQDLRSQVEWHGLPFHYLPIIDGRKEEQEARMFEVFERAEGELLVLARYMQILSPSACKYFNGRAINIHHSFLPSFKGARPYHQAHARGVKMVGATAHFVTTDLDEGPIIEQGVERVSHALTADELAAIGSDVESIVLNRAVKWHAESRLFLNGQKTVVLS
jgi:formyltetrahydrofolate deformylase